MPRQPELAWLIPHLLGPGKGGIREGESPRLAYCCSVLVDQAWGLLDELGTRMGTGARSQASTHARNLEH